MRSPIIGVFFLLGLAGCGASGTAPASGALRVGAAEVDLTPDAAYPMSGYFHERLNTGVRDRLHAKALAFLQGEERFVLVVCDLCSVTPELTDAVRRRTGLPPASLVVAATHTHTGPDYKHELRDNPESGYPARLVTAVSQAVSDALAAAKPVDCAVGSGTQDDPISFCRRFLMKDGNVKTWANHRNPDVVREANPIDPEVAILRIGDRALLVNFALHLDTLGGTLYSADFPYDLGLRLQKDLAPGAMTVFANGCCGNINHADPRAEKRRPTEEIGRSLGATVARSLPSLRPITEPRLGVRRSVVGAEVRKPEDLDGARATLARKDKVEMLEIVRARTQLSLERLDKAGGRLALEVHAVRLDDATALVTLPGECFVEFGLEIKKRSPFKTTFVVELANSDATAYIPTRDSYPLGGYEVLNSRLVPGSGERLVEAALSLLQDLK